MRVSIPVLALAIGACLVHGGAPPAQAVDEEVLRLRWKFTPESTQAHPKKAVLCYVVTKKHKLYDIGIAYSLGREPFAGDLLETGGRVKVNLKILRGDRTFNFGTVKRDVETQCDGYCKFAEVRWNDLTGHEVPHWTDQVTELLPLRLKPGDVVIWTVKFRGLPKIARGTASREDHLDQVALTTDHSTCGTMDRRCPSPSGNWP